MFRRTLLKVSAGLLVPFILFGCTSMPRASYGEESLLVIAADPEGSPDTVEVSGPDGPMRLTFNDEGLILLSVDAGGYSVAGGREAFVPAGSVLLYPEVPTASGTRPATPGDQRRVMTSLTDYVGFESWFGREYLNFGPYRPKQYLSGEYFSLELDSEPRGARILIDNLAWGETPQTIELNAGKYLIEIAAPDHRSYKRIITLDEAMRLDPELEPIERETAARDDRFDIMIAPIRSMSAGEDPYGDVIASTMLVNFGADPRLSATLADGSAAADYPDFSPAEEAGADLLVAGNYSLDGDVLYLEAVLYETTTRRVKYAETYVSEAGFAVFDSIDEVAGSFAAAVSRTLPEPGEPIVEKESGVADELVSYEKSIYREQMIASRLERRNLLSAKIALGGMDDQQEIGDTGENVHPGGGDGSPINIVRLDYQRILTQQISFSSALTVLIQGVDADSGLADAPSIVPSFGLFLGPEFAFRTITSDVYFTPSLLLGFQPSFTVTTAAEYEIPTRYYTGLELDVGYRYFFFGRRDDRPLFLNIGMYFDMVEVGFSPGGDFRLIPLRGGLYIGGGSAL